MSKKNVFYTTNICLVAFLAFFSSVIQARHNISASRYELLSGSKRSDSPQNFWDRKYSGEKYLYGKAPAKFLAKNYDYIPSRSKILDIGMGEGRNAVFLARKEYVVTGIDISAVAIKKARMLAREFGVRITSIFASIHEYQIPKNSFDAIICFYFVDRELNKKIVSWLKPGGILIYEASTEMELLNSKATTTDMKYLLRSGELLTMFPTLKILKYEEALHRKEYTASIILQKKKL